MATSSRQLLYNRLLQLLTSTTEKSTIPQKADELATLIDDYVKDVISKLTIQSNTGNTNSHTHTINIPQGGVETH